jgi:hypothetical protein
MSALFAGLSTDEERPDRSHAAFLQHVLLDALQRSVAASPQQASACSYLCCSMLQETLNQMRKQQQQVEPQQLHDLVLHHRQMLSGQLPALSAAAGLESSVGAALAALQQDPFPLDWQQACAVSRRLVMDGLMGQGRYQLLIRLADASDRGRQDANAAGVSCWGVVWSAAINLQTPCICTGISRRQGRGRHPLTRAGTCSVLCHSSSRASPQFPSLLHWWLFAAARATHHPSQPCSGHPGMVCAL